MMPNMMSGMGTSMFFWIGLITLICILIIGACIWFVTSWSKKHNAPTTHYTPQPRDAYEEYEQGYQSQQHQPPESYQEGANAASRNGAVTALVHKGSNHHGV
jgi:flagellar basal body-associated protein FliL